MMRSASCPDARELQALLQGDLPDRQAEPLEQHLLDCGRCVQTVRQLRGKDTLLEALQASSLPPGLATGAEVNSLIDRLHKLQALTDTIDYESRLLETTPPEPSAASDRFAAEGRPRRLAAGSRLGGYRITQVLGAGGMGVVYAAEDPQLQRPVALKVMRPDLAEDAHARQRFLREARAAAALCNDHIVSIHQVGEDNGVPFLVMPLLQGETLDSALRREKRLAVAEVVRIGREIAAGLAAAHARGLIHRDIKPGNIWLETVGEKSALGRVKILDFGLAHHVAGNTHLTARGAPLGTPGYMAPEQMRGQTVDPRCDLFSLGVVLYVLSSGVLPFEGNHVLALIRAVAMDRPRPLRELVPTMPRPLSDLVMQLLEKKPAKRPASAAEVVAALTTIETGQPTSAPPRRRRFPVAILVLLGALGVGGYLLGPTIYRIVTDQGELVIRSHDPHIQVSIQQNGQEVTLLDLQSKQTVTLKSGTYELSLPGGQGVKLSADRFTLTRNGKVIVEVERMPATPEQAAGVIRSFRGHDGAVAGVAFLGNGQQAVSAGYDGTIRLWEVASGKEVARLSGHDKTVRSVALSSDGRYLVSGGGDHTVRLWDLPQRKELLRRQHTDLVSSVAFAPDGQRFASGSLDRTILLWRLPNGKGLGTFPGSIGPVESIAWSADGKYLLCAGGDRVHLWNVDAGKEEEQSPFRGHAGPVRSVAFAPNGKYAVSGGQDGTVRLWDVQTGRQLQRLEHSEPVQAVAFAADSRRVVAGGRDRKVYVWDAPAGRKLQEFAGHTGGIRSVAVSRDGRLALSGGDDQTIRLWSLPPAD